jgi:hypothetical protein
MKTTQELDSKIKRLERNNFYLMAIIAISLTMAVVNYFYSSKSISSESIQLVNQQGKVIAGISSTNGETGFYILDNESKKRLSLFYSEQATGLYIKDSTEATRIGIAQFSHGGGGVALHGENSEGATVMYHKKNGRLSFYDQQGVVTNEVSADGSKQKHNPITQ